MKRLVWSLLLLTLILVSAPSETSADTSTTAEVIVRVATYFEVKLDRTVIDFKTMRPGETKDNMPDNEGVKVTAKSNSGNPWFLLVNDEEELTAGEHVIPNENFFWYGYRGGKASGVWHGNGSDYFTTEPVLAYVAGESEYNNMPNGTDLFFKFKLKVPKRQARGNYRTAVVFTITE
jgi:hypothetical protein